QQGKSQANGARGRPPPRGARGRPVPLFDPVAGMRAMADIQAEGLRAASDLLERVLEPDNLGTLAPSPPLATETDYAGLVSAWAALLQQVASGLGRPEDPGPMTVPVDGAV